MFMKLKNSAFTASTISLFTLGALAVATPSSALSPNLSTWSTIGDVTTTSSQAILKSGTSSTVTAGGLTGSALETFLGILNNSFDSLPSTFGVQAGSAIKTTLIVNSGDVLSFDWSLVSSDSDTGFVTINNAVTYLTGTSFSQSFATAGSYNIGIGVLDVDDTVGSSTFTVNNVNITACALGYSWWCNYSCSGRSIRFGCDEKINKTGLISRT